MGTNKRSAGAGAWPRTTASARTRVHADGALSAFHVHHPSGRVPSWPVLHVEGEDAADLLDQLLALLREIGWLTFTLLVPQIPPGKSQRLQPSSAPPPRDSARFRPKTQTGQERELMGEKEQKTQGSSGGRRCAPESGVTGSGQSRRVSLGRYLAQVIFDLSKDGVSFESLQVVARAGENCTNLGAVGAKAKEKSRLRISPGETMALANMSDPDQRSQQLPRPNTGEGLLTWPSEGIPSCTG